MFHAQHTANDASRRKHPAHPELHQPSGAGQYISACGNRRQAGQHDQAFPVATIWLVVQVLVPDIQFGDIGENQTEQNVSAPLISSGVNLVGDICARGAAKTTKGNMKEKIRTIGDIDLEFPRDESVLIIN